MKSLLISLIVPLNLCIFLVIVGAVLALLRRKRLALLSIISGVAWTFIWSLPMTSYIAGGYLENRYPHIPPAEMPTAQAIVVFGGSTANNRANWFEPYTKETRHARIDTADDLFFMHKAPLIIVSGAALEGEVSEAKGMSAQLQNRGIPKENIITESQSTTTRENAFYVDKILKQKGITDVLLVTSALHMPRSMAVMQKLGYHPIAAANPPQIVIPDNIQPYLPDDRALEASRSIIKEYIGLLTYYLRGWI
ncbi:YdcF family protein [Pelistega europaea]|uniref:YdcF family protein n=1 Tax=Pelistega europaea TaxID=106147 RepID=A0A7Y4L9Z2_9BURK|nr:YdcF family protein [Pelistega europaea]NOL49653.1 YdcF family protein [Pelistega europaea]